MSCCSSHVKAITSILGATITTTYLDLTKSPPALMTQAEYDALELVKCPTSSLDREDVCIQPEGNTDASKIEKGFTLTHSTVTYEDEAGVVAEVTVDSLTLHQADGTDVTASYEAVSCPEAIVVSSEHCVAPA